MATSLLFRLSHDTGKANADCSVGWRVVYVHGTCQVSTRRVGSRVDSMFQPLANPIF